MPTSAELAEAKSRAKTTIQTTWRDIARSYTLGWGGPIDVVERAFPFIGNAISDIRDLISVDLPVIFFQSRESPPKDMIAAIGYVNDADNPFNCRLAGVRTLTQTEAKLYSDFAQAFWFCIYTKLLPTPRDKDEFKAAILDWTGHNFFTI